MLGYFLLKMLDFVVVCSNVYTDVCCSFLIPLNRDIGTVSIFS